MKKLAIITLHGMGNHTQGYEQAFQQALTAQVSDTLGQRTAQQLEFIPVTYGPILQQPQDALWQAMLQEPSNNLDYQSLREFLLYGLGDAGSLAYSAHRQPQKYLAVQETIVAALTRAFETLRSPDKPLNPNKPVILVAHSLGCQVLANYLWDVQHKRYLCDAYSQANPQLCEFLKLSSAIGLVTLGCNIPLFTAGLDERRCFNKPNADFQWLNIYDPDDVLGWPLKQLGPSFEWVQDKPLQVGNLLSGWTPLSHSAYWNDKKVLASITPLIKQALTG
ncbi:hypothetical protein [Paraferrimonas haliotis]|uniref:Uncharacterized protein n=1 Tax=Paraferrimonas haliotis TaxID=2013866 RepID=A0AA37TKC9_9GAMM|nr:hypothetical protein [Paraferrimonas haliotis]GLS82874.1 hypothetical protein GCM10007894_08510 [Paraferrimonas haliotis]